MGQYSVWGRFYEAVIAGKIERMRSHLEIFPAEWNPMDAVNGQPDLLVIMMNPGGSAPLPSMENIDGYVPAKPDRTQYQVMQLMDASVGLLKHARILNLSDIREPKSKVFQEKLKFYDNDISHSIFDESRVKELERSIDGCRAVLRGWGLTKAYGFLASRAIAATAKMHILGVTDDGLLYRHPLPQNYNSQQAWLLAVSQQLADIPNGSKA